MTEGNLFGWSDALWLMLDQIGILASDVLMAMSVMAAILGWLKRENIRNWFRRNSFPDVGGEVGPDERDWDGMVFTVSREEVPRWVMKQVKPAAVAFVCTKHSREAANHLARHAEKGGAKAVLVRAVDPDDPADARFATTACIDALHAAGCRHVAVDVTGGKTPMSLGAFMAAEEQGADSLYVSSEFDADLKKPRMETARIVRVSSAVGAT